MHNANACMWEIISLSVLTEFQIGACVLSFPHVSQGKKSLRQVRVSSDCFSIFNVFILTKCIKKWKILLAFTVGKWDPQRVVLQFWSTIRFFLFAPTQWKWAVEVNPSYLLVCGNGHTGNLWWTRSLGLHPSLVPCTSMCSPKLYIVLKPAVVLAD